MFQAEAEEAEREPPSEHARGAGWDISAGTVGAEYLFTHCFPHQNLRLLLDSTKSITAHTTVRTDDAVARYFFVAILTKDAPDRAVGFWSPCLAGDFDVRHCCAPWNL